MFLGIDQSLRSPGFAVIDSDGKPVVVENLKNSLKGVERLAFVRDAVAAHIRTHQPSFAALEGYSLQSINRPFDLGEVGGIVRLALFDAGVPFVVVTPTQLKKFVTGSGGSTKEKVQEWIAKKWAVTLTQDDQADAYGLAQVARIYHTRQSTMRSELEVVQALSSAGPKISTGAAKGRNRIDT